MALHAAYANAAPVRLNVATDRSGQGWLFGRDGACAAVTAGHVVAARRAPLMIDTAGAEGQGQVVAVPGAETPVDGVPMDAALLDVTGALAAHCEDDLGFGDISPTLDRIGREGGHMVLEKLDKNGSLEVVDLALVAVNRDGMRFTVRPADPKADPIAQGDSGSPVLLRSTNALESGLPLGLITRDLGGAGLVLRMDAIRHWVDQRGAASQAIAATGPAAMRLLAWSGDTSDAACGPLNLLHPEASCGWRARAPAGSRLVSVDMALQTPPAAGVSSVTVALEDKAAASGIAVSAAAGDGLWQSLAYCPMAAGELRATCGFAPNVATSYRVSVEALQGGIRSVELR